MFSFKTRAAFAAIVCAVSGLASSIAAGQTPAPAVTGNPGVIDTGAFTPFVGEHGPVSGVLSRRVRHGGTAAA